MILLKRLQLQETGGITEKSSQDCSCEAKFRRSFHHWATVNMKALESDCVLCVGNIRLIALLFRDKKVF